MPILIDVLHGVEVFFIIYMILYACFFFTSILSGASFLYQRNRLRHVKNELIHDYYVPVSILVPAHNEQVTILQTVGSLLKLDYKLYEIIVIDDGSDDETAQKMIRHFGMHAVGKPIRLVLPCKAAKAVYECEVNGIRITLIQKENGGKSDALNMGINASVYPYFICLDADSLLQRDSLEQIVKPVMEDDRVVAVGGVIRVAQCAIKKDDEVVGYHLPWNMLVAGQVMEYARSFMASRIFLDRFNANLIISGAFGLFKKELVCAVGGYDTRTVGEDMELVVKLHSYCRNNDIPYAIRYEPTAVCWSQVPGTLGDLRKQRRRWHLGLYQSLSKYRSMILNTRFGVVGTVSYLYYLLFELFSPQIELLGLIFSIIALKVGYLNMDFMLRFYLLYALFGITLTLTAFSQRVFMRHMRLKTLNVVKILFMCLVETVFLHFFLNIVRATSFIGYRKRKSEWGSIKRTSI